MSEKIGFIGLGIMGRPMAINLCKAGYELWVHARRPEMMTPLVEAGATACPSPQAVASQAEIIFTMVADTADVEQVILGDQGILSGAKKGSLVVDMSSISASATRIIATRLAEQGIAMLDAPVSGGEQGAIAGTLSIMVGGEVHSFNRALPFLKVLGSHITRIGEQGAGQIAKTCNQILISQTIIAVGETLLLAKAAGVNPDAVRQALLGGFANSRVLEVHGQRMLEHRFAPGFKIKLHQKDLKIALQLAHELGLALPGAALSTQYFNVLMGLGQGELDSSATVLAQEQLLDIYLTESPEEYCRKKKVEPQKNLT
jgi:2-hydroxy-3-oxopropionate reductase